MQRYCLRDASSLLLSLSYQNCHGALSYLQFWSPWKECFSCGPKNLQVWQTYPITDVNRKIGPAKGIQSALTQLVQHWWVIDTYHSLLHWYLQSEVKFQSSLHQCRLPSFTEEYTQSTPLTRIRDIAHRVSFIPGRTPFLLLIQILLPFVLAAAYSTFKEKDQLSFSSDTACKCMQTSIEILLPVWQEAAAEWHTAWAEAGNKTYNPGRFLHWRSLFLVVMHIMWEEGLQNPNKQHPSILLPLRTKLLHTCMPALQLNWKSWAISVLKEVSGL